jgi:DnaJ-class molecular chaperone
MVRDHSDDYYALLGIDAGANAVQLRRAWRRLAMQWHPDHAGPNATSAFQKMLAAYEVLSNPVARAAYDRKRDLQRPGVRTSNAASPQPPTPRRRAPGVMLSRVSGSLNVLLSCGVARHAETDVIEISLSAQEGAQGGMITISMRVPVRCPACAAGAAPCTRCGGKGTTDELFSAWLAVPPEVTDGTMLDPSVLLRGMVRPVRFRIRVRRPR